MNGHRRFAGAALSAALLLAAPAMGLAQGRNRPSAANPAPSAPAARSAPAPQLEPAPVAEPVSERGPWRIAATLGRESDGDADLAGPRVGVELETDLLPLGARGLLSFLLPIGWFHASDSVSVSAGGLDFETDTTLDLLEIVPSFRAGWSPTPRLRFFAEIGVGAAWASTKVELSGSLPTTSTTDGAFAGVVRFGAGASYLLNERIRLGVELPTFHRRYGESTSQTFTFSALAAYAF